MLGYSFAVLQVQVMWCACQNTLRRSLLTFFEFLWHVSRHFPSVRAENKQWLMRSQAVLHWAWWEASFHHLLWDSTGSSGCIRVHWGSLLDRYKRDAVGWSLVFITDYINISVKGLGNSCRQHHWPSYCSLCTWHLLPRGTGSMVPVWQDLKIFCPQVDTTQRAIGIMWKADTVDL